MRPHSDAKQGFILVAVLWILAAVTSLALVYHAYVATSAVTVGDAAARLRDRALFTAAVELAAYQLLADPPDEGEASRTFSGAIGDARVTVTTVSEAARVDLNAAPAALLAGLIAGLGPTRDEAAAMAARIVGWRSPSQRGASGDDAEDERYRNAGLAYLPRHGPFAHPEELRLVLGLPQPIVERLMPLVTTFSGMAAINVIEAAPAVLAALPHSAPAKLAALLAARDDPQRTPRDVLGLISEDAALATLAHAPAWRMSVKIERGGRRAQAEAVVLLAGAGREPYHWLARFDKIDLDAEAADREPK